MSYIFNLWSRMIWLRKCLSCHSMPGQNHRGAVTNMFLSLSDMIHLYSDKCFDKNH